MILYFDDTVAGGIAGSVAADGSPDADAATAANPACGAAAAATAVKSACGAATAVEPACGAAAAADAACLRILFIGDVCGNIGTEAAKVWLPKLRAEHCVDVCVANAENASPKGVGCNRNAAEILFACGVDVITLGNHAWSERDAAKLLDDERRIVRPANYPPENPGVGSVAIQTAKGRVGVVNIMGQLFMDSIDCPFHALDRELAKLGALGGTADGRLAAILVDMHAEATSEKVALAYHADGRVSCVIGTHTHVQTADERVLAGGVAFISDAGMTGPADGIIGTDRAASMRRFLTRMPTQFLPAKGRRQLNAVVIDIDLCTGKATAIKRINLVEGT